MLIFAEGGEQSWSTATRRRRTDTAFGVVALRFGALGTIEVPAVLRKNAHRTNALCGVAAMMTVADCRKRAHDCIAAARLTSDRDGQLHWQRLSDAWLMFAEHLGRGKSSYNETPVAAAGPVAAITDPDRTSII